MIFYIHNRHSISIKSEQVTIVNIDLLVFYKGNIMIEEIQKIAINTFVNLMQNNIGCEDNFFWQKSLVNHQGTVKPLYICGTLHKFHMDGTCIAIVNPQLELLKKIHPGVGYTSGVLKEFAAKKCDFLVSTIVKCYSEVSYKTACNYASRTFMPPTNLNIPWPPN